jgi:outer membrane protein TolC
VDDGLFGKVATPWYNTWQLNASLIWRLPLGRWIYKGELKLYNEKIALQEIRAGELRNALQQEIAAAKAQLQEAREQLAIAKEALATAADAMQQSIERQKLSTAKPFEVFQAQQFYRQAQLDYIEVVTSYNKSQYDLFVAAGYNF